MIIDLNIPDSKSGDWSIKTFEVSDSQASSFNIRCMCNNHIDRKILPGKYTKLKYKNTIVMSNTPAEINDHIDFINKAKKSSKILINGLGLGVALTEILKSKDVESITVIEKSKDVINLVGKYYNDPRVNIINYDCFDYVPPKDIIYDVVWHDIWNTITSDNLLEMDMLINKYKDITNWQDAWCYDLCLQLEEEY